MKERRVLIFPIVLMSLFLWCLNDVAYCFNDVAHCLNDVAHCLIYVAHCLNDVMLYSNNVVQCLNDVVHWLNDVVLCLTDVVHALFRLCYCKYSENSVVLSDWKNVFLNLCYMSPLKSWTETCGLVGMCKYV